MGPGVQIAQGLARTAAAGPADGACEVAAPGACSGEVEPQRGPERRASLPFASGKEKVGLEFPGILPSPLNCERLSKGTSASAMVRD